MKDRKKFFENSNLAWTAVRPVFLNNSKKQQGVFASEDDRRKPNVYISRESLAVFILEVLEKDLYLCQAPVVSGQ